ncbi:MAG: hypothetical protein A2W00_03990 [Candidatus Eisenbacteria bacterium RBG_16_71_46]|nr:MAG: hypothetical protein A2W00_03990 [Candidatus Eisenbacteria bacterium RBG_16_71_46]
MSRILAFVSSPPGIRISRIAVGLVMLAAALAKIGGPASFAAQIRHFRMLPDGPENLLAITLPWIELLAGLALVAGVRARAAAWLSLGLMAVFTLAVGQALGRGLDIECGCFGTADASRVGTSKLLQNLAILVVAWIASQRSR